MPGTFISQRTEQFDYFDRQLGSPDWTNKRVMDFGGSAANILRGRNNRIEEDKYWAVDLSRDAIALGARLHPRAHMVFYDRYSFEFNPTGVRGLPIPDPGVPIDIALVFSVFTHTSKAEMLDLVGQLRAMLADDGVLAFTFLDPHWAVPIDWAPQPPRPEAGVTNLRWGLSRRADLFPEVDVDALLARAGAEPRLTWINFLNNEVLCLDTDDDHASTALPPKAHLSFCTAEHMRQLYPEGIILEPLEPEPQHCCVLGKTVPWEHMTSTDL